jgi:hypothetical protein
METSDMLEVDKNFYHGLLKLEESQGLQQNPPLP